MFKKLILFIIIASVVVSLSVYNKKVSRINIATASRKASKIKVSIHFNDIRTNLTNTDTKVIKSDNRYDFL